MLQNHLFFLSGLSFTEHLGTTGQQGKGESFLTPPYHIHPLQKPLNGSRTIIVESSPLHIASDWTRNAPHWFTTAIRSLLRYAP